MRARIKEDCQLRRLILAFGALASSSGAMVLVLSIARCQLESVTTSLRLLPTGATVCRCDSHQLRDGAFPRHTTRNQVAEWANAE